MKHARPFLLVALALLAGCDRRAHEDQTPAPSSSVTRADAILNARIWAMADIANRSFCEVRATGSMVPIIDSRSILLLERASGADLRLNDIALWERTPGKPTVCHRVKEVRPDGILFDGDNNRGSDGWVSPSAVRYRVAGILYTSR